MNRIIAIIICTFAVILADARTPKFDIDLADNGPKIQKTMYGVFFEDINFAADGGIYAELVKNRSFEYPNALQGWNVFGNVQVNMGGPFENCPHYVTICDPGHKHKHSGIENEGWFGMGVKDNSRYRFSVWARSDRQVTLRVEIADPTSNKETHQLCKGKIFVNSPQWQKYELCLTPSETKEKAVLRIFMENRDGAAVDLEHVSLFPEDTWMHREGGLRKDLVQALADLKPGIFRFPGGCIVEGTDVETRYDWKKTLGQVENRPLNRNRWEYTFPHRLYPDYFQSGGLGFYEYFQLSEDIGSEPLPVLNCGLVCQYQNDDSTQVKIGDLQPYIQDALDLIEFANGTPDSRWGAIRAEMGHFEPFNLKFIAIGNEQWGPLYPERLELFIKAIRSVYPEIKIIGSSGPDSEGAKFDYLWPEMRRLNVDLVDEHFYRPYEWFLSNGARYDSYDRQGPKVFAGEYACHAKGKKYNHFLASLYEAAFMTGLERNADVVQMATYAPLFAHIEGWQWRPDLIWYDNLRSCRSISWYVQQLYSLYKGENVVSLKMDGKSVYGGDEQEGLFSSAVKEGDRIYVKVANTSEDEISIRLNFSGTGSNVLVYGIERIDLSCNNIYSDNSLESPNFCTPQKSALHIKGKAPNVKMSPLSFSVFVFEIR